MDRMIELALAFNDQDGSYSEHAAAVLASVFRNTVTMINVHILHDETLTEENQNRLAGLASSFNHQINFYPVALPVEMAEVLSGSSSLERWTSGSLYRLLLPTLVSVDKVIYLDCDILVNMDISELWDIDLNGCYLAAVRDQGIMGIPDVVASYGLNPETYFNSGVIVFELNNIRQNLNWYVEVVNFLRNFPGTTMPDQDTLNYVFGGNYLQLDERFNSFSAHHPDQDFYNKIVHFAGDVKWWDPISPSFALYEENLNMTPWRTRAVMPAVMPAVVPTVMPAVTPAKPRTFRRKTRSRRYLLIPRRSRKPSYKKRIRVTKNKQTETRNRQTETRNKQTETRNRQTETKIKQAETIVKQTERKVGQTETKNKQAESKRRKKTVRIPMDSAAVFVRQETKKTAIPRPNKKAIQPKKQSPRIVHGSRVPTPPLLNLK